VRITMGIVAVAVLIVLFLYILDTIKDVRRNGLP